MNDESRWPLLASAMRRVMLEHVPDWTDSNDHDPGITLLNLFTWLTDALPYAQSATNPEIIAAARRLATAASGLANAGAGADSEPLLRVNYFHGKLLGVDDFRDEQTYFRRRLQRLNQRLHGVGVVSGLNVSIKNSSSGASVEISPGLAIDPTGEEVVIADCVVLPLPGTPKELYVQIRWTEQLRMPVPTTDSSAPTQYSRIVDTWETVLSPAAAQDAVTLARLTRISGRWTIGKVRKTGKSKRAIRARR
ncbi:hypothetical protein [Povalibacter sp.]|uniref:hypothetical protein n=1 Tax=Povalibacter sp. TaxID=1962978 RepID=UPI002F4296C8